MWGEQPVAIAHVWRTAGHSRPMIERTAVSRLRHRPCFACTTSLASTPARASNKAASVRDWLDR